LDAFHYLNADIALPADQTEDGAKARVGFDTPGRRGKLPDSFRARSAVAGQKIHPGMPEHHEQFRFHD